MDVQTKPLRLDCISHFQLCPPCVWMRVTVHLIFHIFSRFPHVYGCVWQFTWYFTFSAVSPMCMDACDSSPHISHFQPCLPCVWMRVIAHTIFHIFSRVPHVYGCMWQLTPYFTFSAVSPMCMDACDSSPCKNAGVCAEQWQDGRFLCDCAFSEFAGPTCETGRYRAIVSKFPRFSFFCQFVQV